jgi:hypothetical protein
MYSRQTKAVDAAVALAKSLSLPSGRGSVFAWRDAGGDRIVVAADQNWIAAHRSVPATFRGYPVVVSDRFDAVAHVGR